MVFRKRDIEFDIFKDWIEPKARVLDLGCGRGVLLENLCQTKSVYGVGVDSDFEKVSACVRRGVNVYHGDVLSVLMEYPDGFFDWVICSRTLEELSDTSKTIEEALRVGKKVAIAFANYGYWRNRLHFLFHGNRVVNQAFPGEWDQRAPTNPVSVNVFESFCAKKNIRIVNRHFLKGDWDSKCSMLPSLFAGYALYVIGK